MFNVADANTVFMAQPSHRPRSVELIVKGYDEADASRTANRQGIFVGHCVPLAAMGTFARVMADDAVAHALLAKFPNVGFRLSRMNAEDQEYLLELGGQHPGISREDASHIAKLIRANRHLPRA